MKIAIIAHDGKKADMVAFLLEFKKYLSSVELVSTGTTGFHVEKAGLKVHRFLSGPMGGDAQIAALAAEKNWMSLSFLEIQWVSTPMNLMFKCS